MQSGEEGCSSRRKIAEKREDLRNSVLTMCLEKHRDRLVRPVTVFQNLDKLSNPWVQALPGPNTGLSAPVFVEVMAARLCLHSPAVVASGMVGTPVGTKGEMIDPFGDSIQCCKEFPGDSFRHRHDTCKHSRLGWP